MMMMNSSNDDSTIRLTKAAVAMAFPEFEDDTEEFPSFDRLYLEVDDSLSMLSSSVGHLPKNNNNNVSDLEVPSTPTTCTSWFSPPNTKKMMKSYRRLATRSNKERLPSTNDNAANAKKRCGCWDSVTLILCLIILCGCGLLLYIVLDGSALSWTSSCSKQDSNTVVPYNHTRNDTEANAELQERRDIIQEWLEIEELLPGTPQRQAVDWLGGGGGDLSYILGDELPSKQEYDIYQTNITMERTEEYFALEVLRERITQRYALLVIYFALGGKYPLLGWATLSGARLEECSWPNVACDFKKQYITQLQIDSRMVGRVPSEIGLLSKLETLRIEGGSLTGELPTEIYDMTNLYSIAVTNTGFLSRLDSSIGRLSHLECLDLRNGGFVGTLPTELGHFTTLRYLLLDSNDFAGTIPSELGVMNLLDKASFHDTWISGEMPPAVCKLRESILVSLTANCLVPETNGASQTTNALARLSCDCCTDCV